MRNTISNPSEIDNIFAAYTQAGSPGCSLIVVKDGHIICNRTYGLANLELEVPITNTSTFNIGSMAKQFTAFAIALLAAEGKISLDDDIRQHLPEMHDFGDKVTLRHLIHHTSGVRNSFPALLMLAEWRDSDTTTQADVYQLLKAQRALNFRPGAEFEYSNSNYVLLAQICAQVSGQTFADFCQERIFAPLNMHNTWINALHYQLIPGRALGYYDDGHGHWVNATLTDSVLGSTNIYTTAQDLAKWEENFYTGTVGGKAISEQMHQRGRLNDGTVLDYAFGLELGPAHQHQGWQIVEHGGSHGGYCSHTLRFPELHLSVIVLRNHFAWDTRDYALKVAALFVPEHPQHQEKSPSEIKETPVPEEAAHTITLDNAQLAQKSGIYFNAERVALRIISVHENRLQFGDLDLIPLDENRFYFEVEPETHVTFTCAADGEAYEMKTITASGDYAYTRVAAVTLAAEDWAIYTGRYYSPELDVYWTLSPGDECLLAHRHKYKDSQLTPLFKDVFRDDWTSLVGYPASYTVCFQRNAHNEIEGLSVSGNGARHIQFVRLQESIG